MCAQGNDNNPFCLQDVSIVTPNGTFNAVTATEAQRPLWLCTCFLVHFPHCPKTSKLFNPCVRSLLGATKSLFFGIVSFDRDCKKANQASVLCTATLPHSTGSNILDVPVSKHFQTPYFLCAFCLSFFWKTKRQCSAPHRTTQCSTAPHCTVLCSQNVFCLRCCFRAELR